MDKHTIHRKSCIVCEKELLGAISNELAQEFMEPPWDATFWRGCGNFGSTVLDSMGEYELELYICDDCLTEKMALTVRIEGKKFGATLTESELQSIMGPEQEESSV